ncbi:MKRN2 ligase, partial [Nesospiza acunhae]|nr:MKRN2 ligase [Nesospiza acunhae]
LSEPRLSLRRYFLQGVCREGSKCLFSHDLATSKSSTICKYYQKGQCAYGSRCRGGLEMRARWGGNCNPGGPGAAGAERGACACPAELCGSSEEQARPAAAGAVPCCGACHFGERCLYLHGQLCEICGLQVLHPFDQEQRKAHEMMCMATFEHDMERAFAIQASQDKVCSICMEVVYEKASASERRFGILSNCTHTYCLSCIRQWRCAKQFENPIIKSCPECRVISEFVIPSVYWVEEQEKKNELIEAFKQGVGKKPCKYFEQGKGTCPFGGKCLYLHAYPDGTRAEPEKPRKQLSSEGTVRFFNSVRLWDFIEDRESRSAPGADAEVTELGELFMHLSGAEEEPSEHP